MTTVQGNLSQSSFVKGELDFFTPISFATPNKSWCDSFQEAADDYFFYGNGWDDRAFVVGREGNRWNVQLIPCGSSTALNFVKIATLFTGVIPLFMFLAKAALRHNREYAIVWTGRTCAGAFVPLYHKAQPSVYTDQMEKRYQAIFKKAGIDYAQATPLQRHVVFFANGQGELTKESIRTGFERLRFARIISFLAPYIIFQLLGPLMGEHNGALSMKDIDKAKHPSDTGVFTSQGQFDPAKFEAIRKQYAKVNKDFLTAGELDAMRAVNKERDENQKDGFKGSIASLGEFRSMLDLFSDGQLVDANGNIIPTISFSRLRDFYTGGPKLFEEVASQ